MMSPDRRTQIVERTGIDEDMIERLVRAFYDRVRKDVLLGPIFAGKITSWEPHLERMCAFWSSVVLMTGRYRGQPMEKHFSLSIDSRHFNRWLQLFGEAAMEVCPSSAARHFIDRATRIAESLQFGIDRQHRILDT